MKPEELKASLEELTAKINKMSNAMNTLDKKSEGNSSQDKEPDKNQDQEDKSKEKESDNDLTSNAEVFSAAMISITNSITELVKNTSELMSKVTGLISEKSQEASSEKKKEDKEKEEKLNIKKEKDDKEKSSKKEGEEKNSNKEESNQLKIPGGSLS